MSWAPLSLDELLADMDEALREADDEVVAAWERIRIAPEKWRCSPWGDHGGGFWVVAETPLGVVWYNDIEDGFNTSSFTTRGVIDDYMCNQGDFRDFLLGLPEAATAEAFAEQAPASSVPPAMAGPGRIAKRQTTYWVLHADGGATMRVHFTGKQETRYTTTPYARVDIVERHPLLLTYEQPWLALYVTGAQHCKYGLIDALSARILTETHGLRSAEEYLPRSGPSSSVLLVGDGLLLRAPEGVARAAADVVREWGARPSLLDDQRARPGYHALLLGQSYVIARAFRFEVAHKSGTDR